MVSRRFGVSVSLLAALALLAALLATAPVSAQDGADGAPPPAEVIGEGVAAAVAASPSLVVVALDVPGGPAGDASPTAISAVQDQVLAALPLDAVVGAHRFTHVPALALLLDETAAVDALADAPGVRKVDLDVGGSADLGVTVPLTDADERHTAGNDGSGVTVAVIDTGIDSNHLDLASSVAGGQACFGWNGSAPGVGFCPNGSDSQTGPGSAEDDQGHGTHVSGIVTSDGVQASDGFAPGADVVALKSIDANNFFYSFTLNVVAALDYIIANPGLGIDVINMSLGTNAQFAGNCDNQTSWTMAGAAAVNTLRNNGVTSIAAAGNAGSTTTMAVPGCLTNVISVGASDNTDSPAGFTNVSTTTDIFAPGVGVVSSKMGGGTVSFSGTSMSSPSAAGCAALFIESGDATTPSAIETRLETSAVSITAGNGLSYPRIDCGVDATGPTCMGQPATIVGTNGPDNLVGTPGNDVIVALGGDDSVFGDTGDDLICLGAGNDTGSGQGGNDTIHGEGGADVINGGPGHDFLDGGADDDLLGGQAGNDDLDGGDGHDDLFGDGGNDLLIGGAGNDLIRGSTGVDEIDGGTGNDDIQAGGDADVLVNGGPGDDMVRGGGGDDTVDGSSGSDIVQGGTGDDTTHGGPDADMVTGNANDDTLHGDDGDDQLFGGPGFDTLIGGPGADLLRGNDGADDLDGGDQNDTLFGDNGNDVLHGGAGNDTLNGGNHADALHGDGGVDDLNGNQGGDTLDGGAGTPDDCNGGAGPDIHAGGCEIITNIP